MIARTLALALVRVGAFVRSSRAVAVAVGGRARSDVAGLIAG